MRVWFLFACASAWLAPQPGLVRSVAVHGSLRDKAEARQREREATAAAEAAANARQRLEYEYAAYKRSKQYAGETLDAFAARRARVGVAAQRNGWALLGLVVLLNAKLAMAPADLKKVAQDPNGLCVSARGDRLRGDQAGLTSSGDPCMPPAEFARRLLL